MREIRAWWLPDSRLGGAVAALFCCAGIHSTFCRGTPRCARRRFGVPVGSTPPGSLAWVAALSQDGDGALAGHDH